MTDALLTLPLWLPAALFLAYSVMGLVALGERSRTGVASAGWRAATYLAMAAACGPLAWAPFDALLGGNGAGVNSRWPLFFLALGAVLYLPTVRLTRRGRGGRLTVGLRLWPLNFLLLIVLWGGWNPVALPR
ncbi:hypothetical protein L1280_000338 [Deinococcus sp. HSC-46F16]|uniref:hypothetical protein n=1 Tax=Deinococcus sp. HSC-46F16 TaxID=2910968 RepID=UPI0020A13369|nr:hypothetical protein [Deinococcus sp. HSC-46F16]MCP2013210.1 hypothetical protein [Deinococcus sp. HSC-46F16]